MNIEQLQQVHDRLQTVLAFANAQGESGQKTALKVQMIMDETDLCIRQHHTRRTYLLELMLQDCVVRSLLRADLCRPMWNGRPVVFATGVDAHERAISAHEKLGIDIMI